MAICGFLGGILEGLKKFDKEGRVLEPVKLFNREGKVLNYSPDYFEAFIHTMLEEWQGESRVSDSESGQKADLQMTGI
jgi:hypothetical protein